MPIHVWGCRGSLPTPGPSTVRYRGNTTCFELRLENGGDEVDSTPESASAREDLSLDP